MKIFARVQNGVVAEILPEVVDVEGQGVPIVQRFSRVFLGGLIDVTDIQPTVAASDLYDGNVFSKPASTQPADSIAL